MASSNEVIDRVPRILSGDPTVATGAATKQYVDAGLETKAAIVGATTIAVVTTLPATPDANTIYLVTT